MFQVRQSSALGFVQTAFDDDFVQVAGQADECFSFHLQRGASLRRAFLDINQGQTHAAHIVEGDDGMVHRRLAA
jgi:hypothetical protein